MSSLESLAALFFEAAERHPEHTAVVMAGDEVSAGSGAAPSISYRDLAALAAQTGRFLQNAGVKPGDRVGIYLPKSIDAVAAIFGCLSAGAAYVPVDPGSPPARNAFIFADCAVRVIFVTVDLAAGLRAALAYHAIKPRLILLDEAGGGASLVRATATAGRSPLPPVGRDDLAYILYTSGSTGKPKGVMLTHGNALTFVDWCSGTFAPTPADRFSSHAPFHFDLSILDIYVSLKHGATLVLIPADIGKDPRRLAPLIAAQALTVWYSTPSVLTMLYQYGQLPAHDFGGLRLVLFAGEVFPVKHLRALMRAWPGPAYFNLYGPTETNVCTFYQLPATVPADQIAPFPIGKVCPPLRARLVAEDDRPAGSGVEGELYIAGPGVMKGYWGLPDRTAVAFLVDADGCRWYKTGDIIAVDAAGNYTFTGRRDRMVKKRGFRIELGEIEAALYRFVTAEEVAVIAYRDKDDDVRVRAIISYSGERAPSIITLKRFCKENLPDYMIPDYFSFTATLPKTTTNKIDYQRLLAEHI